MPTVRDVAENAWFLLISRAAAGMAIPFVIGAFVYAWDQNADDAVQDATLRRHTVQIDQNTQRITARETNAFTQSDAAAMEARLVSRDDALLEELRLIRQELQEDRRRRTP